MRSPSISFVVSADGSAAGLSATLDSLFAQTMDAWEAVVIGADPGEIASADPRLRRLAEGQTRQGALDAAAAPFAAVLAAGDVLRPDYAARMLDAAGVSGAIVVCTGMRLTRDGEPVPLRPLAVGDDAFAALAGAFGMPGATVLVATAAAHTVGGLDPDLGGLDVWDLAQRITRSGASLAVIHDPLVMLSAARFDPHSILQGFGSGLAVLERFRAADPRVAQPDRRFADGLGDGIDSAETLFALRIASIAAGAGIAAPAPLDDMRLADLRYDADPARETFADGVLIGAGAPPRELPRAWAAAVPHLKPFFQKLGAASSQPGFARSLPYTFETWLVSKDPLNTPLEFSTVMGVRQGLRPLKPIEPPEGVDTLYLRFVADDRTLAALELPVYGALSARDVAILAAQTLGADNVIEIGGLARKSRFRLHRGLASLRLALGRNSGVRDGMAADRMALATMHSSRTSGRRSCEVMASIAREARRGTTPSAGGQSRAAPSPSASAAAAMRCPVLMYHRVCDSGPEALAPYRVPPAELDRQLALLRDHGFESVDSYRLDRHRRLGEPLPDKPVLLSFDDAYVDFHTDAWPILERHGFHAEVFVVIDKVGGAADWDSAYGPPAPIMDWEAIVELHRAGIAFGSHLASHTPTFGLSSAALLHEAVRSRAVLEQRLSTDIISISSPYGIRDARALAIYREAGYRFGYTTDPGVADSSMDPLELPRIEIVGNWPIESFAQALGIEEPAADIRRRAATSA